jgi:hypothetical protein
VINATEHASTAATEVSWYNEDEHVHDNEIYEIKSNTASYQHPAR